MAETVADAARQYVQGLVEREWQVRNTIDSRSQFTISTAAGLIAILVAAGQLTTTAGTSYEQYEGQVQWILILLGLSALAAGVALLPWNYGAPRAEHLRAYLDAPSVSDRNRVDISRVYLRELDELVDIRRVNTQRLWVLRFSTLLLLGAIGIAMCVGIDASQSQDSNGGAGYDTLRAESEEL